MLDDDSNELTMLLTCNQLFQVNKMRSELMDSVRKPMTGPPPTSTPTNITGLFQEFEYLPSRYNLEDELNEKERLDGHRKRREVGFGINRCPTHHLKFCAKT